MWRGRGGRWSLKKSIVYPKIASVNIQLQTEFYIQQSQIFPKTFVSLIEVHCKPPLGHGLKCMHVINVCIL